LLLAVCVMQSFFFVCSCPPCDLYSCPTRRSSDLISGVQPRFLSLPGPGMPCNLWCLCRRDLVQAGSGGVRVPLGGSTIGSARTLNVVMSSDLCAGQNPGMAGAPLPLSLADTTANQPVFTMTAIESLLAAHRRIASRVSRTPLLSSSRLNQWLGHDIYFKAECLQKVGAFKARGA